MKTPSPSSFNELVKAVSTLTTEAEIKAFFNDVFTPNEIDEAANRFQIAKTLWTTDKTYLEIAEAFKTSTTTVTRVANWLFHKKFGGYRTILSRLYPKT
jgi:TrpR-related protein YerC/YecD